jgi:hypothetical protein
MGLKDFIHSRFVVRFDPARTQAARRAFDIDGGYDSWATYCRNEFRREPGEGGKLAADGFEVVNLLTPAEAAAAKETALDRAAAKSAAKASIDYADVLRFDNTAFLRPVVEKMLNPGIDGRVTAIFGSEYYVHSLVINRTMPAKASKRSFLWHCDRGPRDFLKINMFLDATAEHGGTTEFVTLEDSLAYEKAGYTFGANRRRVHDLSLLSRRVGPAPKVHHPQLSAGEAFMFFPARVLHRGYLPSRGIRHMMSLVLLPSPVPWREAWSKTVASGYHANSNATFPGSSRELLDVLGLPALALAA